jgi:hypothetical protein
MVHLTKLIALLGSLSIVPCTAFKVLIDLNLFSRAELLSVGQLPAGLDGAWEISVNSPNTSDLEWKSALQTVAPTQFVVTEDNPMGIVECQRYARIAGHPPSLAFNYHETGGAPHTMLNTSEIREVHAACGAEVVILTRAYWPGSEWRSGVLAVLNDTGLGGVAMEFNPGDFGKRLPDYQ